MSRVTPDRTSQPEKGLRSRIRVACNFSENDGRISFLMDHDYGYGAHVFLCVF